MATSLCAKCSSLKLSAANFVIADDTTGGERHSAEAVHLQSGRLQFGTLAEVRVAAATCQLCALIAHTACDMNILQADDVTCHFVWEIDGRTCVVPFEGMEANRTRRLRVCWNDSRLKQYEAYLVLAAPAKYDKSDIDYRGLLNKDTQFLGRRLGCTENKKNLIREFLRLCETRHDHRCSGKLGIENPFRETLMEPYFGVIDIENDRLVPLPFSQTEEFLTFESYATASYVWGPGGAKYREHTTRICNIQSRLKSGGLAAVLKQLPLALRESISLVHSLGIKYIWIDALCIVQDSSHSWNLNSRAMHLIYGNSVITICAADGVDATTGLLALDENHQPEQKIAEYSEGVHLILHRPSEISIETSRWNKRAWTFQERLLSKRCLIFTEGKVYFQCRSTGMSEDVFADQSGRGWSLDLVRAPLQLLSQLKLRALWFYIHCVSLYTLRQLYEPFDILAAFSGTCKLMEETMRAPFIFGLPVSHFDFVLLWEPIGPSNRLKEARMAGDPKYKDMQFPSWSWCGWESTGIQYNPEMVDGCLADIHAWLMEHT